MWSDVIVSMRKTLRQQENSNNIEACNKRNCRCKGIYEEPTELKGCQYIHEPMNLNLRTGSSLHGHCVTFASDAEEVCEEIHEYGTEIGR